MLITATTDVEEKEHRPAQVPSERRVRQGDVVERPCAQLPAAFDPQQEDPDEDERGPREQVKGQLHRAVFLESDADLREQPAERTLARNVHRRAPDADEHVHREHGQFVEEEEQEKIERDEHAVDAGDQKRQEQEEFLLALLERPRGENRRQMDEGGQHDERNRDPVHPYVPGEAQAGDHRNRDDELIARDRGVEAGQKQQGRHAGDESSQQRDDP
jgi:hypothetical protein